MDRTEKPPSRHDVIGSARHDVLPTARAVLCIARRWLDGNNAARSRLMATAAIGAPTAPHGPSSSATHPPPSPQLLRRALPRRIAMDLLDDAARDCVKRSMTSRPCWRPRGRREHRLRLMQPAGAAATTASRPTAWLASPLAERHQRGAVSNASSDRHMKRGRPRAEERSRAGRLAAGGRHRERGRLAGEASMAAPITCTGVATAPAPVFEPSPRASF